MAKKGILMGDMHTGSIVGLTPSSYHNWVNSDRAVATREYRKEMWREYLGILDVIGPVDFVIHNGDATDGMQGRQGKTDLIGEGWADQQNMAVDNLSRIPGDPDFYFTVGTDYHVVNAEGEDVEQYIADAMMGPLMDRLFVEIEGVLFDCRHFIGASSIKHLRHTALARENATNCDWKIEGTFERIPDVIVRSHVHYFVEDGGVNGTQQWKGIVTPALQGLGGKFGARKCSSVVHWGLVEVEVDKGELTKCKPHIITLERAKMQILKG